MPLVGTWIEILSLIGAGVGLFVVPLVGTWIEISTVSAGVVSRCRAPRGHVD